MQNVGIGIVTKGHLYLLNNYESDSYQQIQFIEKEEMPGGKLSTVKDGTTNEAVLMMLIDRLQYLSTKLPSRETSLAITKLEEALMWLEKRTQNRKIQEVEGSNLPHKS